ncbi:hypothetical protein VNO78_24345 [Psophocarpus tetragonolobus]|uniref:Hydrophobic seed protein domain-containing protein n=1 Tax=Psophocarpus tetragonolobus TaxID=3891 RepID=A0AAN9S4C7_PSOTE
MGLQINPLHIRAIELTPENSQTATCPQRKPLKPPKTPCCNLIQGLADLEAALCLCTVERVFPRDSSALK